MGALFSLTPPLLEAVDDIKRLIAKYRKPREHAEAAGDEPSLKSIPEELRTGEASADGSPPDERNEPKR